MKIIIIKCNVLLKAAERQANIDEIERQMKLGYIIVPPGFEIAGVADQVGVADQEGELNAAENK